MRVALDTNFLVYAEGVNGLEKRKRTLNLLTQLPDDAVVVPVQALGELFQVLVRKAGRSATRARAALLQWQDSYPALDTTITAMLAAANLAQHHHLGIWDAVMLSTAAEAGCRFLLSEDMHDGFTWNGVTVSNPFADPIHPALRGLLPKAY